MENPQSLMERLRQHERDLTAILDNMPSMIGYWDRHLRNRFGNYAYKDWFGIDPATMPGMHIREVIGEERYRLNLPYMEAALRGERQTFERAIPTPDGSRIRYSLAEYIPDIRDGEVQGFFVLVSDVTRLKETEMALRATEAELRRSNEELESFACAASHDLRQPLRTIASFLGLLNRGVRDQLDEENRSFLDFAIDGAKRLDRMIVALLDYARIGRERAAKEAVDLGQMVARTASALAPAIAEAGATLEVPRPLPVVPGFASELERLFQNLIGNAVKFRAPGRAPRIVVECRDMPGEWVVTVADNGIGIPADQRDHLFQVFQRVARDVQYEGTGIGLAACRKIAERHGGRIWVESEENQGCTLLVALPKDPTG
ncbi:MAG: sensor histidine kinase [Bacteroidales bacterium]